MSESPSTAPVSGFGAPCITSDAANDFFRASPACRRSDAVGRLGRAIHSREVLPLNGERIQGGRAPLLPEEDIAAIIAYPHIYQREDQ